MEKCLFIIKPDAKLRQLDKEIKKMLTAKYFAIVDAKEMTLNDEQASFLTEDLSLQEKASYIDFMTCAPCELLVIERKKVFPQVRRITGNDYPQAADKGTIRSRFGIDRIHNAVYTSPDLETAEKEIEYFF